MRGLAGVILAATVGLGAIACDRLPFGAANGLSCIQLDLALCQQKARELGMGQDPRIVGIQLECTALPCTPQAGEIHATIRNADGSGSEGSIGWAGAEPGGAPPGPPVQEPPVTPGPMPENLVPTCIDIAAELCAKHARDALTMLRPGDEAASIVVRCDGRCDEREGSGLVTLTDTQGRTYEAAFDYRGEAAPS